LIPGSFRIGKCFSRAARTSHLSCSIVKQRSGESHSTASQRTLRQTSQSHFSRAPTASCSFSRSAKTLRCAACSPWKNGGGFLANDGQSRSRSVAVRSCVPRSVRLAAAAGDHGKASAVFPGGGFNSGVQGEEVGSFRTSRSPLRECRLSSESFRLTTQCSERAPRPALESLPPSSLTSGLYPSLRCLL
jgi:hypothetical protein